MVTVETKARGFDKGTGNSRGSTDHARKSKDMA
jgi:hypothetical protein